MTEQVGSAAEEAARLLAAVQDWARTRFDGEHLATGGAECQVCPLCQAIALVRHLKPETAEHLLDGLASFVAALKSAVAAPSAPDGSSSRVQPIDIREG
jgi:hypothetical protein